MKKVAVVTLHYIRNYGSLLQTYATQKKFELMGYSAEIVDYVRPNAEDNNLIKAGMQRKGQNGNAVKKMIYTCLKKIETSKRKKVCDNFLTQYIHLTRKYADYADLKNNPPSADIYVTGSDQTWNSEYNGGVLPAYYLDFAPEGKKRIGYSISIGMDQFPNNEIKETTEYVKKYTAISVREESAKKLIEGLGIRNVQHILDPTLVLNKEEWSNMIAHRMIQDKYIIIYRLNDNPEMEQFAQDLAKKTGCKIVRMSYYLSHYRNKGKMIYCPTVQEFLSLINYADYVVTDSFHCTAFSLNFHKEFFVFYPGKYNTRLQSVLELTGTAHRVMNGKSETGEINFNKVDEVLNRERKKVDDFIQSNF